MDEGLKKILTGNFIGSQWNTSPKLTPYGEAIAAHYPIQVPWIHSQEVSITRTSQQSFPIQVYLLRPQLYDVLICGASILDLNFPGAIDNLYLNITNEESGIPWVAPTTEIGYSPVGAFGAVVASSPPPRPVTNVSRLPEAYFLPRYTMLRFEWTLTQQQVQTNAVFTFLGIQLINHRKGFEAPKYVNMPDGSCVKVGHRLPLFITIPYGDRRFGDYFGDFALVENQQTLQFTPASDCDIEIHDVYANFLSYAAPDSTTPRLRFALKIADKPTGRDWTPGLSPIESIAGYQIRSNPQLPYPAPSVLEQDHRYGLTLQNNNPDNQLFGGTLTFRGVRRCQY